MLVKPRKPSFFQISTGAARRKPNATSGGLENGGRCDEGYLTKTGCSWMVFLELGIALDKMFPGTMGSFGIPAACSDMGTSSAKLPRLRKIAISLQSKYVTSFSVQPAMS